MKRTVLRTGGFFILLALLLGCSLAAAGQSTIQFNNASVYGGDPGDGYGSIFGVGLYQGTVNGSSALFVCDDFVHDIVNGQSWSANGTSMSNASGRFQASAITNPDVKGKVTTQQEYNMVGYLVSLLQSSPTSQWQYISWAIWSITDGVWHTRGCTTNCTETAWYINHVQALVLAALAHDNQTYSFTIWTPTGGSGQEFIQLPESALLAELLMMFSFVGFASWKRSRAGV